jgi:hypothetical protein
MPELHAMDSRIILHEVLARNTNISNIARRAAFSHDFTWKQ